MVLIQKLLTSLVSFLIFFYADGVADCNSTLFKMPKLCQILNSISFFEVFVMLIVLKSTFFVT